MTEAFICDSLRTPIGRYGGGLGAARRDRHRRDGPRRLAGSPQSQSGPPRFGRPGRATRPDRALGALEDEMLCLDFSQVCDSNVKAVLRRFPMAAEVQTDAG